MDLTYKVHKTNRKTISLTLERNNEVVIKAPNHATDERIEDFFRRKQEWLYTKLEEKNKFIDYPNKRKLQNGR
jgi:predicted metal-dependent hydrolase